MPLPKAVSATITAQNTFTDPLTLFEGEVASISVSGVSDSTVTVQRKLGVQSGWQDVTDGSYTANAEESYVADEPCELRVGVKTGGYGTDTVVARLGKA